MSYRCRICDYSDSAPSLYHSSLAGVNPKKVTFDPVFQDYICNDCRGEIEPVVSKEEGEVEYDIEE